MMMNLNYIHMIWLPIFMLIMMSLIIMKNKIIITMLLVLELILLLSISMLIPMINSPMTSMFILILLCMGACEACIGLSLLVTNLRSSGKDYLSFLNMNND